MSTSIELVNLSRRYGAHVHALREVSLAVDPGEFVTLLGPSGSGKSTILKLIAGFEQPSGGDILVDGRSILRLPSHRREIGMVFQNYALFPHLNVEDNICFPLQVRRCDRAEMARRLDEVLAITRLTEFRRRLPQELSGGQQQRVALARAIIFDPKILLMDEPLAALDRHLREQMKIEIKRIQQELAMTVLFVTHDQDEALLLSDRIGVMQNGSLAQLATPRELYARPQNRFVAGFVGEANILPCQIRDGMLWLGEHGVMPAIKDLSPGDGWLMLRPEHLTLCDHGQSSRLRGRIRQIHFLGDATRYVVETQWGEFRIRQLNAGGDAKPARYEIGAEIFIGWLEEHAIVLRH